jgi:HK97 family phage portal protein
VQRKPIFDAIFDGLRSITPKASLDNWLNVPLSLQEHNFWRAFSGTSNWTGTSVTVDHALQLATVWSCVRLISETIATLPLPLYERTPDGSRRAVPDHPLYELLHDQPNADMTAAVFWEVVAASLLLWGNAYVEIIRAAGRIIALQFLNPARMTLRRTATGEIEYRYRPETNSAERVIRESNLMHVPAFTLDGREGISPIRYGANVLGGAIETDKASAETFESSMQSPGLVTVDMLLKPEQRDQLRAHVKKVSDEGGVMVLEKGSTFQPLQINPKDAELLASRAWNVEELCRWFRVDPAMIGHGSKDSNWGTGLEQKMLWFLTFTLRHWCVRIEQSVRKNLLTAVERKRYFAAFNMEGLLRADSASRAAFYATMVNNGIYTRDECRQLENRAPMGGNASVLTVQSAMVAIDDMASGSNASDRNLQATVRALLGLEPVSAKD